uniref:Ribosomal protein L16 n=1 Tax=Sebdenia flabellata TaxID=42024 RepID=A0A0E3DAZ7_9FLOR|nr:ribosomal protein L16 [Sebdenia flabellata]
MFIEKKTHNNYSLRNNQPNSLLKFGRYGIKVISFGRISEKQLKSIEWILLQKMRVVTSRKPIKFWNLVKLNLNLTKLSLESRMGKGKGNIYTKAMFLKPGIILFEFDKISDQHIFDVFTFIRKKIPAKVILVKKWD